MGGRGSYSGGGNAPYTYKTVGKIEGIKVLQPNNPKSSLKLPEEAHSSSSYILLDKNGIFHQMRIYNKNHEAIFEIGYHKEANLGKVLHVHLYKAPGELSHKTAKKIKIGPGDEYYEKYKKFFKGIKE